MFGMTMEDVVHVASNTVIIYFFLYGFFLLLSEGIKDLIMKMKKHLKDLKKDPDVYFAEKEQD